MDSASSRRMLLTGYPPRSYRGPIGGLGPDGFYDGRDESAASLVDVRVGHLRGGEFQSAGLGAGAGKTFRRTRAASSVKRCLVDENENFALMLRKSANHLAARS